MTEVSRTAELMAFFRALETARPANRRLFADPFASRLLSPGLRAAARAARLPLLGRAIPALVDARWPGPRSSAVARTRVIDDALAAALACGVAQVLLLGAGFDCRALRVPSAHRARFFEIDRPALLSAKRVQLGAPPPHVIDVGADLERGAPDEALLAAGFSPEAQSFAIWEGVSNYLSRTAIEATLGWLGRRLAPGSRVAFTYVDAAVLRDPPRFAGAPRWIAAVVAAGEPWIGGLDPAEVPALLERSGLALERDESTEEIARRLGSSGGSPFYRVVLAERPAG